MPAGLLPSGFQLPQALGIALAIPLGVAAAPGVQGTGGQGEVRLGTARHRVQVSIPLPGDKSVGVGLPRTAPPRMHPASLQHSGQPGPSHWPWRPGPDFTIYGAGHQNDIKIVRNATPCRRLACKIHSCRFRQTVHRIRGGRSITSESRSGSAGSAFAGELRQHMEDWSGYKALELIRSGCLNI